MKIKIIQLINNFFKDQSIPEEDYNAEILGAYCTLGYFDALQIEEHTGQLYSNQNPIWDTIDEVATKTLDGTCTRRNLICIAENEETDEKFWNIAKEYPYLFVSLVRIKHSCNIVEKYRKIIEDTKMENTAIIYFSYNHSEMIIIKLAKAYSNGMDFVLNMRRELDVLNMYTVFSIKQEVLDSKEKIQNEIEDEKVNIKWRITIKDDINLQIFLQKLWEKLYHQEIKQGLEHQIENFRKFYTLGSSDMIVETKKLEMTKILHCYGRGGLLTHSNIFYNKAVYNIETEIFFEKDKI